MKIKRVDDYSDDRFNKIVLEQHGAYIIDDIYPCQFLITSKSEATMYYHDYTEIDEIIKKFRFYSKHITRFYDTGKNLLREYKDISFEKVNINELQPSQFLVDESKLDAISSWATENDNFIIPVFKKDDEIIILDGHTRLYLANTLGIKDIIIYEDTTENESDLFYFVNEAKRRNIYSIKDIKLVKREVYIEQWDKFCDAYFYKMYDIS